VREGTKLASARQWGQKFTGLYRDAQGRQKSAGSFNTKQEALKAVEHAEAVANPPKPVAVFPTDHDRWRPVPFAAAIVSCTPLWSGDRRRLSYGAAGQWHDRRLAVRCSC
jgi:hypothetical protein